VAMNGRNARIRELEVRDLSLREKVGQVLMLGFAGTEPEGAVEAVCDLKAGGIIYFARNTGSVAETATLSRKLQEMATSFGNLPLLISTDQEGGPVVRLDRGLPLMPGAMSLGATGDPDLAFRVAHGTGTQLRAAGISVNLAPVLDVNDNPANPVIGVRSFGSGPSLVETLGTAAVRGFMSAGIAPVGKHFPGHGNTSVDSHFGLPVLPHPLKRLAEVELRPFKSAVRAGLPAIMTAHILFSAIDPERPATLSEPVLEGLLRRDMGFQGVIMTDCMEMRAIADDPGTARGAVLALKAGADMVLISHTPSLQREAYEMICEAVKRGEIPPSRLDDAVRRILALKKALRAPNPLPPEAADTEELRLLSEAAHLRSVTVLKSEGLPLRAGPNSRFVILSPYPATDLGEALGKSGAQVVYGTYGDIDLEGTVIVLTENAWKNPKHAEYVGRVLRGKPGAVVVATRDPYDFRIFPEARSFICTYSRRAEALKALARILTGAAQASGRLPVRLQ
jgi:beta-N-acetylhexosaminidase